MKTRLLPFFCLGLLMVLAACSGAAEPDPVPEAEPSSEDAPTQAATAAVVEPADTATTAPSAIPEPASTATIAETSAPATSASAAPEPDGDRTIGEITIAGAGGLTLIGTFQTPTEPGPHPTVLLLHMLGGRRDVWTDFAASLNEAGYNALALDMRGHGATGGSRDWTLAEADLLLVWQYLADRPDVDPARIAIIGGSIGANMALITGANVPEVSTVVLLSPGLDYRGVQTEAAVSEWGDRPLFIVASQEDSYAADSSAALADLARHDASELYIYDGAGHGTNMFNRAADLTDRLLAWLESHL